MYSVYKITSPSGKAYVGITKDVQKRWGEHSHSQYAVGNAIRKYGDAMRYEVLATVESWEEVCAMEEDFIVSYNTKTPNGYNLTDGGDGSFGYKHTDETRAKISKAHTGKKHTDGAKEKISKAFTGKKLSDKHKAKISRSNTGRKFTDDHKANLSKVTPEILFQITELSKIHTQREVANITGLDRKTIYIYTTKKIS